MKGKLCPDIQNLQSDLTLYIQTFLPLVSIKVPAAAAAAAKSLQSCPTVRPHRQQSNRLPIPGILQARTLEWLPFPSPMHESEK